ncbi:putative ABC transporter permease protein [Microlunatus phosphovorus NM-1]|uniref:Putative ABC transporter permease protein n=1 Tax=Microlunatus phosphovorus (strain ATCC 700054 / DSM 10555 / JCM 9379 / NBRC 101784 / NCIMB 13414 / VKM Ac-1990 / NM-1) TaxID=1032480 RepID=F5XH69_MICPN|nr:putative ABC transporter permease protein [Microlunatus phosphovorus NM-1]
MPGVGLSSPSFAPAGARTAGNGRRQRSAAALAALPVLIGLLATAIVVSIGVGAVAVAPGTTIGVIGHRLGFWGQGGWTTVEEVIVWDYRVPRVLLAALVGGLLALVGAVLQAVVRNPLADPWVLGVSSGAGLGAVALVLASGTAVAGVPLAGGAAAGSALATTALFVLARRQGRLTPVRLVLAGVALSYLFSAGTSYLVLTSDANKVFGILYFLLGSVAEADRTDLLLPAIALLLGALHVLGRARALDALMTGDETAVALGVSADRVRGEMLLTTSVLTGVAVAVSGGIGFVGLVVPHITRMVVGAGHRRLLPTAVAGGAVFLVLADTVARTVAAPLELPIGVVTALVGAPFFLWLMRRDGAARRGGVDSR